MLGAGCVCEEDTSRRHRNGELTGEGVSYLAFDFTMEVIAVRAKLLLQTDKLPPALRPMDAEISFDDICSRGISIIEEPFRVTNNEKTFQVTVTVSTKRPPKFFTGFEHSDQLGGRSDSYVPRRRATAIDFAMTNVVSLNLPGFTDCIDGDTRRTYSLDPRRPLCIRQSLLSGSWCSPLLRPDSRRFGTPTDGSST